MQNSEDSWRKFQSSYLTKERQKIRRRQVLRWALVFSSIFLIGIGAVVFKPFWTIKLDFKSDNRLVENKKKVEQVPVRKTITRQQLVQLIEQTDFIRTDKNLFFVDTPEQSYQITTSIDVDLQEYLLSLLQRAKKLTRGKPQRIAIVVMDVSSGKIVAMTGFDLDNPKANPCITSDYPAASIFKIVTAAAAVQELGYTPHTPLYFNGNKYTLYKRQLKEIKNKYTYKITFSKAFAESINPVFGKIGKNYLGKEKLDGYASAFGFNEQMAADLTFESGNFSSEGSDYHLAELGCGFNTDTTISPVFGAVMVSTILNAGNITFPRIIEHGTDSEGEILYKSKKASYKRAITPDTAKIMVELMAKTVSGGTARKTFRGSSRDKILKNLIIGGKTGSLYNREHTVKYDWFTGFGEKKGTDNKIALSIVVGHRKYIGTRATAYAKMILKQYFKGPRQAAAQL